MLLNVGSGGTDVCSGIVQGDPLLPVSAGQISGPSIGVAAATFDEEGNPVVGQLGELVITKPMPSMPVGLWGDTDGQRMRDTYFDVYPGIWRHGDWIVFEPNGSCHVAGRSDATLNHGGVRLGTAEFYRVTEEVDGVHEALVVHLEEAGGNGRLLLFVVPDQGRELDDPGADAAMSRLTMVTDAVAAEPDCDLVIETGPERLDFKRELFAGLDAAARGRTCCSPPSLQA